MTDMDLVGVCMLATYVVICGAQLVGYVRQRRQQRRLVEKYRDLFDPEDPS